MILWSDFKSAVRLLLPIEAQRRNVGQGTNNVLDLYIRQAVLDLQHYIPYYRLGHETVYQSDDVQVEGFASVGALPDQGRLREMYFVRTGKQCISQPMWQYPWENRKDLICGHLRLTRGQFAFAIDPMGKKFYTFPAITDGRQVSIFWDGSKLDFANSDYTPFDEEMEQVVADWCMYRIRALVDHDLNESGFYLAQYTKGRQKLFVRALELTKTLYTADSPHAGRLWRHAWWRCHDDGIGGGHEGERNPVEFCAFGDSGDPTTIANTAAVANLVRDLEPDFIVHMGDTNYPSGDPVQIQDVLLKYYGGFIPRKFYLAFGNHDIMTDGGTALDTLLADGQGRLNSGLRYYDFIPGARHVDDSDDQVAHIFVLDSNDPQGCLPGTPQGIWLADKLAASVGPWNIVMFHEAAYTSDVNHAPGNPLMRADYKGMGAHIAIAAHGHNYERLEVGGFPYIVCGLGGGVSRGFTSPATTGSQFRWTAGFGALWVTAKKKQLQVTMEDTLANVIDSLALTKPLVP